MAPELPALSALQSDNIYADPMQFSLLMVAINRLLQLLASLVPTLELNDK